MTKRHLIALSYAVLLPVGSVVVTTVAACAAVVAADSFTRRRH